MIKRSDNYEKTKGGYYTLTEWARVIHLRASTSRITYCGLTARTDLSKQEAFTNHKDLCNGCFT